MNTPKYRVIVIVVFITMFLVNAVSIENDKNDQSNNFKTRSNLDGNPCLLKTTKSSLDFATLRYKPVVMFCFDNLLQNFTFIEIF
jgi:hypothetical protein